MHTHALPPFLATTATTTLVLAAMLACPAAALAQTNPALNRPPQDEIFYQIMPIAWRDSDNDVRSGQPARFGDFGGLTASLDYLDGLGVTSIYLQPIFPSPAYHGYQHGAGDQINPWFGTEAQFLSFVTAAHARGMKVHLDYVAYGISHNSVYYTSAYNTPASVYDTYLAFTNTRNTQYQGYTFNTWNGANVGFIHWNLNNAGAVSTVTNWAKKWLDPNNDGDTSDGVDGFRLDHAYADAPEGWGATIGFWQNWSQALRAVKPGVFIFCEPGDWGSYGNELMTPTGFDAVITKPFQFASRDAVNESSAQKIYDSVLNTVRQTPAGKVVVAQPNDHDSNRLASIMGDSAAKQKAVAAIQFTQPFPPSIWYGDELGMRGTKASFGSDADDIPMREPFKWNAVAGPPMSNYHVLHSGAYANRVSRDNDGRSVQEQAGVSGSMLETYRALISVRKDSVALRRGDYQPIVSGSSRVFAFVRQHEDQSVVVAINMSPSIVSTTLNLSAFPIAPDAVAPVNLWTDASMPPLTSANAAAYPVALAPYSWLIAEAPLGVPATLPPPNGVDGAGIPADFGTTNLRASQTVPPSMGDNVGELNQLFVKGSPDALRIGITGNIPTDGTALALFVDPAPLSGSGQSTLNTANVPSPPSGISGMAGTTFDIGFSPRHMLFINCSGGNVYVDHVHLLADGSLKFYRGQTVTNTGASVLINGGNASGLAAAVNRTNTAGITSTSVAGAGTATTGFELAIPYADVGMSPSAPVRAGSPIGVSAALVRSSGQFTNQFLPGLPATQTADLGSSPNLNASGSQQWAAVVLPGAGDFNADGMTSIDDIFIFLNAWFAGAPGTDVDASGATTIDDIFIFLNAWFNG